MFEQVFVEHTARTHRPFTVALSFASQVILVALAVLVPLTRTEALAPGRLLRIITAPGPWNETKPINRTETVSGRRPAIAPIFTAPPKSLMQPTRVPERILFDEGAPTAGVANFDRSGTGGPDGIIGGIESVIAFAPRLTAPEPVPPASPQRPAKPVPVGGRVQAAKLIHQVKPVYPPLARQTRISGLVRLEAIIGKDGGIRSLQVMIGHPLLVQAALDAVRQWSYQATLLNDEPVEVLTQIDVYFKLSE
jgi:protein TonB